MLQTSPRVSLLRLRSLSLGSDIHRVGTGRPKKENNLRCYVSATSSLSLSSSSGSPTSSSALSLGELQRHWEVSSGQQELSELKVAVQNSSLRFDEAVKLVSENRVAVEEAQRAHDDAHKNHASLLMRRESWTEADAAAFVRSTATEVSTRQALTTARETLRKAEEEAGRRQQEYMNAMRERYHEEQVFQEKWRVMSTYWTWALIGLNSVVFLASQFFNQRRENQRLKAMETLIVEKLQLLQDNKIFSVPPPEENQEESATTKTASSPEAFGEHLPSTDTATAEGGEETPDKTIEKEATAETIEMEKSMGNDENKDAWSQAWRGLPVVLTHEWAKLQEWVQEMHGPSVAVGAAGVTIFFLVVLAAGGSQKR